MENPPRDEMHAMPFREWMRRALHDPECGYYSRHGRTVGRRGDFSTSATASPALGQAIASWLKAELRRSKNLRTVIEVGGGDGSLMRDVRRALGLLWRWRLRFFMVESSPVMAERQKSTLGAPGVRWFTDMNAALEECHGRTFIFHNELLDAFPVTLVEWNPQMSVWQEVWLHRRNEKWSDQLHSLEMSADERAAFSVLQSVPSSPQRCELGTAAREWLQDWSPRWREGAMLTIDYGGAFPQLYHRRPHGTLRGYLAHQMTTGANLYQNMGRQDITADVNFTDLVRWGESLGWTCEDLATQRDFLLCHLRNAPARAQRDAALRFLLDEHGAGSAFSVLVQRCHA